MHRFIPFFLSLVAVVAASAETAPSADALDEDVREPFQAGEVFQFRVSWGLLHHAAEARITTIREEMEGFGHYRVTSSASTRGLIRAIYPMDNETESLIDAKTGRILATTVSGIAGKRPTKAMTVMDYGQGEVVHVDYLRPERNATRDIPPGVPLDLISSLLKARVLALSPGEDEPVLIQHEGDFYALTVSAVGVEEIDTPLGSYQALLVEPHMKGEAKGLFKRGGQIRIWVSQDERRLPLKMEVKLAVGTATVWLTGYQPPGGSLHADSRS